MVEILPVGEPMALNLKNPEVERLVAEVAAATGETRTEAVRRSLEERLMRLTDRRERLQRFLEGEAWPLVPARTGVWTRADEDELLGYGPEGE
jgi:antitoxin VapB